ncbi:MAG: type I pullulanase, partial [Muribaculaceae bacterium]|nr:type I pullulanase [Muribaculaceae bacterium]
MAGAMPSCQKTVSSTRSAYDRQFEDYPTYNGDDLELSVDSSGTNFRLWSPKAEEVTLNLYNEELGGEPYQTIPMEFQKDNGTWTASLPEQLYGKYYTFKVKHDGKWLAETPGVWAKAVGANGKRAAIIDFSQTDPEGWGEDKGPKVENFSDVIVYEMHHRDFSMSPTSGITNKGKFIALTEQGTVSPEGQKTGIDHLKELGVTHVHILPSYDYNSVDETAPEKNQYNWGYDPQNYNAPEGSYSTHPSDPATRVKE